MKCLQPQPFSLSVFRACGAATGRALRSLGVVGLALTLPLLADTTVPPTTVTNGQTLTVQSSGQVTTSGTVEVQSGGTAVLQGSTGVRLLPGFHAATGSNFQASINPALVGGNNPADTDDDGMTNVWETAHGLNPSANDAAIDSDADGLTNLQEFQLGLDPQQKDNPAIGLIVFTPNF